MAVVQQAARWFWRTFRDNFVAATVAANLMVVTEWLWLPLDDAVAVVTQAVTLLGHQPDVKGLDLSTLAVVKISPERFARVYAGNSPLDRCALKNDLQLVLQRPEIQTVAVDLDLSPTERGEIRSGDADEPAADQTTAAALRQARCEASRQAPAGVAVGADPIQVERNCQCRLDDLLEHNASRLVLMAPGSSAHPGTDAQIAAWHSAMKAAGVQFGDATLTQTRGIVRQVEAANANANTNAGAGAEALPLLGDAAHAHIQAQRQRAQPPRVEPAQAAEAPEPAERARTAPIAFHALTGLHGGSAALEPTDACFQPGGRQCQIHAVLFGAGYSPDDKFETPIATMDGVDVHAAIAACPAPTQASARRAQAIDYVVELLFGIFCIAPVLQHLWGRYYATVAGRPLAPATSASQRFWRVFTPSRSRGAYLWLVLTALFVCAVLVCFGVLSPYLSALLFADPCRVPKLGAAFVVGLALDAAVLQGADSASHALAPADARARAGSRWDRHRVVFWIAYIALAAWAADSLFEPVLPAWLPV